MEGGIKITLREPLYHSTTRDSYGNPVIPYRDIQIAATRIDRGSGGDNLLREDTFVNNSEHRFEVRQLPIIRGAKADWLLVDEDGREHEILAVAQAEKPGSQIRNGWFWFYTVGKESG